MLGWWNTDERTPSIEEMTPKKTHQIFIPLNSHKFPINIFGGAKVTFQQYKDQKSFAIFFFVKILSKSNILDYLSFNQFIFFCTPEMDIASKHIEIHGVLFDNKLPVRLRRII
jgi:hypothetical protein